MSISNTSPIGGNSLPPCTIPPLAAAVSIVPVFYAFVVKSAQQTGMPIPKMTVSQAFKVGIKAALPSGGTVGAQMLLQNKINKKCQKYFGEKSIASTLVSSMAVGVISAPILAIFNGQTMGYTFMQSMQKLSAKQVCAITARESDRYWWFYRDLSIHERKNGRNSKLNPLFEPRTKRKIDLREL